MNKSDQAKMISHIKEKWVESRCPFCTHRKWSIGENVFELREFQGGNMVIGGVPIFPVVPVSCKNCGNTVLISGIVAGIIEKKEE